ncbi:acyl-CoA dehydrogenase [Streptomyces lavendulae]|uniref:acyl-CoA dehydrogenase family protein n=1 Tax=Streptomyces lavendulae TaxID=1914 RepID=UPI0033C187A5
MFATSTTNTPTRSIAPDVLAQLLFNDDPYNAHRHWRDLLGSPEFTDGDVPDRAIRVDRAYTRLRRINEAVSDPLRLARDVRNLAALHEWVGIVDGSLATVAGIHYNLFLGSIADHTHVPERDLTDLLDLTRVGTFLCTELDHGNDASNLETTATYRPRTNDFILHTPHPGARKFMPNTSLAGGPKSAVVAARLISDGRDLGVFLFLAPLSDTSGHLPGVSVTALPARTGSPVDHCLTSFDQVCLPRTALLEDPQTTLLPDGTLKTCAAGKRKRFLTSIGRVTEGKICMTAAAVGVSRSALATAVSYADRRHVGGFARAGVRVPVSALRSHQDRLTHAVATGYALTFLHRAVTRAWADKTPEERTGAEVRVAVSKAWVTWRAREILAECRERCGAQGLLADKPLSSYLQDVEGTITAEGDNLAIWVKSASALIFDTDPAPISDHSRTPLEDPAALRDALAAQEARLRRRAGAALRSGPARDPLGRWNNTTPAALDLTAAHAERLAADAFLSAVNTADAEHQPTGDILRQLCRLFLLDRLAPRAGDLLAAGIWTPDTVRGLPETRERLTDELGPLLPTLTRAFGVPDSIRDSLPVVR